MMKEVIVLNGIIINVGPWDYQRGNKMVGVDEETGEVIYELVDMNPLPEGAVSEQRDMEFDSDRGWYEAGTKPMLNFEEDARRSFVDIFHLLIKKSVMTIDEVPTYREYDYKAKVQEKMSDSHA